MNYLTKLKVKAEIENTIFEVAKRENGNSVLYSANDLNELVLWMLPIIMQVIAAPFVADAYNEMKRRIKEKFKSKGVRLSDEDTDNLFYNSFKIMDVSKEADVSWTSNWTS